jgi:hypothetical protein
MVEVEVVHSSVCLSHYTRLILPQCRTSAKSQQAQNSWWSGKFNMSEPYAPVSFSKLLSHLI